MSLATVRARAQNGLVAEEVRVEVHLGNGLPALNIVGLPEAAVREAKDRVRAALTVSGFSFPQQRITINLAPADLPKHGGRFDLPMALGILLAQQALPAGCLDDFEVLGELSLSGEIRAVQGALPAALQATRHRRGLVLPAENLAEARLCRTARLHPMHHLSALVAALHQGALPCEPAPPHRHPPLRVTSPTLPTCAASIRPNVRWKLPQPAGIRCDWLARPAPANPCLPQGFRGCCRR